MSTIPSIPEFYSGRKIFITGGTGFMGKVLIEKLLRSCPDLDTIYLLIRTKKGKHPQDRIQDITRQDLFDTLRRDDPGAFDKLRAISGDVKELGLGLSVEDKEMLQREVSILFHSAASVRFTDSLKDSILMNVRGTLEVVNLALGMENLQVFLHVSTAFSNVCDRGHVEEKMYPPPRGWNWRTAIKLAETEENDMFVNCITPKILGPLLPNTYVFAKALGEQVIMDHRDRLPMVIVRPSIVLGAFDPPLTGWIDNMNGPYGLWAGVYSGFIRKVYVIPSMVLDQVPVDLAVKSMIFISWHRASTIPSTNLKIPVYNCTSMLEPMTQRVFNNNLRCLSTENPPVKMVLYPKMQCTSSWAYFYTNLLIFHVTHGFLLDAILKYKKMKPMFVKTYRQVYMAAVETFSFVSIKYDFDNTEFLKLADDMLDSDRQEFSFDKVLKMDRETFKTIIFQLRERIFHDPIETLPEARRKLVRLYWVDKIVKSASCLALIWVLTTTSIFHQIATLFANNHAGAASYADLM